MSARTRVKICGITRVEDALEAARLGADALGFVFVPASKRAVDVDAARRLCRALPAFVTRVGLFLNAAPETVARTLDALPDLVPQFHGTESAAECEAYARPYLKALPLGGGALGDNPLGVSARGGASSGDGAGATSASGIDSPAAYRSATGFLVDSHAPGALGGTGVALDWDALGPMVHALDGRPLVLAGGLDAANVADAVRAVAPWAVDVSSGVEVGKGIKDPARMAAFVRAVRDADARAADERARADASTGTSPNASPGTSTGTSIDTSTERDGGRAA